MKRNAHQTATPSNDNDWPLATLRKLRLIDARTQRSFSHFLLGMLGRPDPYPWSSVHSRPRQIRGDAEHREMAALCLNTASAELL